MNIRAAVVTAINSPLGVETLELDPPRQGEVLVRIAACGVCHSDYHLVTGGTRHALPVVPGHEGAGVVEAVGEGVAPVAPGDHVVLNWAPACGRCFYCQRGKHNLCDTFAGSMWQGTMQDGTPRLRRNGHPVYHYCSLAAFAEYAVVPQETCVVVSKEVPLATAALVGCAVTTGIGSVRYTAKVQAGECVAVFGCGGVGLSIIMGARLAGAGIIVAVDRLPGKLDLARLSGATHTVNSSEAGPIEAIRRLTQGRGADAAFEAVGLPELQADCIEAARPGGRAVLVGLSPMDTITPMSGARVTRQEKSVLGSYYGSANPPRDFPLLIDLHMTGMLDLAMLVSRTYRLDEINEAFRAMLAGEVARGVVVF
ncbi:MAG: Zn-dependent alcohol dehydrogenase [Acidobacteria bacterium]|nr:Zn-dependent alcohol dehydrogenase [Acidobacteriota bacterium]